MLSLEALIRQQQTRNAMFRIIGHMQYFASTTQQII